MSLYDYFNAFSRYIEEERPSDKTIALYWAMLDMFNRRGWPEWTGANKQRLAMMCNTTDRKSMERARAALCHAGFLEYKSGEKKGEITQYRLLIPEKYRSKKGEESLPQNAPLNPHEAESGGEKGEESLPQNAPLNAIILQLKTKTKTTSSSSSTTTAPADCERVLTAYRAYLPREPSGTSKARLETYVRSLGADLCLRAIDAATDAGRSDWNYLEGILRNWKRNGVRSVADLERRESERRERRVGNGTPPPNRRSAYSRYNCDYDEPDSL